MHDGLGSQLLGALQLARDHSVPRHALTQQLSDTLDQLKLTVDAMQDTAGDLASLLGAMRYRLEPRLRSAGVTLLWSVDELPEMRGWSLDHSRDLQMILYEGFASIMSHSRARRAWLQAWHDAEADAVRIALRDDGVGFVPAAASQRGGRGLSNMRLRAARIGAALELHSETGGTLLQLGVAMR